VLIARLIPESDDGNVEYELQLLNPTYARFARLVTQLKWRLLEGVGKPITN
jgi:GTPase